MRHLVIKNLGPIAEADLELRRINVIVGPQSSGKSCILKTACYCAWVEKRIELTQSTEAFENGDDFIKRLVTFHKLYGYVKPDTYVEYESDCMRFSYDNSNKGFKFNWKDARWEYRRSKVTYIPAERNIVAAIPNWFDVKMADDSLRSFMSDWEEARRATEKSIDVLNLDVKYYHSAYSNTDKIVEKNGLELDLANASSGLQSLIPLYVHLNYLRGILEKHDEILSIYQLAQNKRIFVAIFNQLYHDTGIAQNITDRNANDFRFILREEGRSYGLSEADGPELDRIVGRYTNSLFCDIFIEEPEGNLFPPTQDVLVDWLLEMTEGEHASNLFVTTHSPYIVTSFLERLNLDLSLFLTRLPKESGIIVRTASEKEVSDVYNYDMDVFFNNEYFG